MTTIGEILQNFGYGPVDEENRKELAEILLPNLDLIADEFYDFLSRDPVMATYFLTPAAVEHRKSTIKRWLEDVLTSKYDAAFLRRMTKVGQVHVRVKLDGHLVNATMHFIRSFCFRLIESGTEGDNLSSLSATFDKLLDINLDILTISYREAEMKKIFVSQRLESALLSLSERLLHGLNLVLTLGLLAMALGVVALFGQDLVQAFSGEVERGVIKALGSLLILWMMIELLQAEIEHLKGGRFHLKIFIELAIVALIRKLFVAALDKSDPVGFGLISGGLFTLGLLLYLATRDLGERKSR